MTSTNYKDSVAIRQAAAMLFACAIAIPAEGLRQWAYKDIANPSLLTVCYGHTGGVQKNRMYTIRECKALLNADMLEAMETVERCVPGLAPEPLAAFADAVYNMGPTIVCNPAKSTAARLLKAGDIEGACQQLPRWNKARVMGVMVELPGLTNRRIKERDMCLIGAE